MTSKNEAVDQTIFSQFHDAFLTVWRPNFATALFLSGILVPRLPSIFSQLLDLDFVTPAVVTAIDTVIRERKAEVGPDRRELFELEAFQTFEKFFTKFTTPDTCDLLYRLGVRTTDLPSFFFARLPSSTANFLVLFAFLNTLFKKLAPEIKGNTCVVVAASRYAPASRNMAMKLIAGEGSDEQVLRLALAAAETEDIDSVRQSISRFVRFA
jgi:hypothetical protein